MDENCGASEDLSKSLTLRWSDWRPGMRCLRIYATPDGESHFGEVDIAMTMTPAFPNEAPFELSAYLNVAELKRAPRGRTGPGITFVLHAPEEAPKKSLASLGLRRLYFSDLAHFAPLSVSTRDGLRFAVRNQRVDVLDRQPRIRLIESDRSAARY